MRTMWRDKPRGSGTTCSAHSSSGSDHGSVTMAGSGRLATMRRACGAAMSARLVAVPHEGRRSCPPTYGATRGGPGMWERTIPLQEVVDVRHGAAGVILLLDAVDDPWWARWEGWALPSG